ncbi:MAG: 30S ribosomal protein S6 [Actinobacteria bacterium]|nr:30S ribosomal protein S6 [Actinomycetota bacterium]
MAKTDTNENITIYEIGFLLAPTIPEDQVKAIETDMHKQITDAGGDIVASQSPEMRELSYEIEVKDEGEKRHYSRGQFGWVQFNLEPHQVDDIEKIFITSDDVIRHLLVTVDDEAVGADDEDEE